jgi:DNA-binding response OmpR family regulator
MKKALDKEPYKVITADSAEHAMTRLAGKTPDLILSDVRMPVTNGFELLEKIRKKPGLKKVPFVFMSSIDDFDAKHTARTMGADDYIEKPFDVDNARHIINDLLGRFNL